MNVAPEDLVEAWHLITADGAEPKRWKMPRALWERVEKAMADGEEINAGDRLCEEGDLCLLGTPVDIDNRDDHCPMLYVQRDGVIEAVPIVGSMAEEA